MGKSAAIFPGEIKQMNSEKFSKLFPLGSHLCREPMPPMSELKKDMENLRKHGFNLIKLQEHWQIDEPREGKYDFSRYEELIEHAARLDLGVYLGLTCEQAPAWLWHKYPECRMIGRDGIPVMYEAQIALPGDGKPGPCFDHPDAMNVHLRFISHLVRTLGRYENIVVWNTWQEIGYRAENFVNNSVCFCANTLQNFRLWLKDCFGDLDVLNRRWNTRYREWCDISPTRSANAKGPWAVDIFWQYYMDNVQIARTLRARAEAIKQADRFKRPVFAHKGGPVIGSAQDWAYARCQDFLGSSCYPASCPGRNWDDWRNAEHPDRHAALLNETWEIVALKYDYIRSCNLAGHPVWAAELQGGPVTGGVHIGRVPSADDMRRWILTALGSGVSAISFWVTRAEIAAGEADGFALLDSQGDTTPRFEEAARIGKSLNKHADVFGRPTTARSDVGIIINEMNYQLCMSLRGEKELKDHLSYSIRGWHRLLWDEGIPVDFVNIADIERAGCYKVLILPFPLLMSEESAAKLCEYVKNGGSLISEVAPGRINEYGFCNRGELSPIMRYLFGVRHESITMIREPKCGKRWSLPDRTWGEYVDAAMLAGEGVLAGHKLCANVYLETFCCEEGRACLRYGDKVAGVERKFGRGKAYLLGTVVGHVGTAYRNSASKVCVRKLLSESGVGPEHSGKLLLRRRVAGKKAAWIFTNPTEEKIKESICVRGFASVNDLLGDKLKIVKDQVELVVDSLDVRVLIVQR